MSVIVKDGNLFWGSVGDSRIYLIRDAQILSLTREHNYRLRLSEALKGGRITREQYAKEEKTRQAEALISYIGMGGPALVDTNASPAALRPGDILLLCSDGLYKSLEDSQIWAMVRDNDLDMQIAADRLVDMAISYRGGPHDNTSVLLIRYEEGTKGDAE